MNKVSKKVAAMMVAATLSVTSLPFAVLNVQAAPVPSNAGVSSSSFELSDIEVQKAFEALAGLGIIHGYIDHSMGVNNQINRAELAKMIVLTFKLQGTSEKDIQMTDVNSNAWYYKYASELVGLGIMETKNGAFNPKETVTDEELVQVVSKALNRDMLSVNYWAKPFYSSNESASRGEVASLLNTARKAIPSVQAQILSVKSINNTTVIVTLDAPLTGENEVFAKAKEDFVFNDGLTLTNMPRLKSGSIATYIVPTSVQQAGTNYTLTYKGKKSGSFVGNTSKVDMMTTNQVANDTFEIEVLKVNGVIDYGYVISAYSGGRGANAFVLDENNTANSTTYQIISSMQGRQVTITPEGGESIVAKYVPFTQSTDGKMEPKFRLPAGQVLKPGVKYTVTSDWATIVNPTFEAKQIASLQLSAAEAVSETSIHLTLAQDPGDELFSGRSVELITSNGEKLVATYKFSSRKGAVGTFDIVNKGIMIAGTTYIVTPVGAWATASQVTLITQ
ncbi:S-layer homology domain-containing protein [Paenibacillus sp. CMAA1364]